MGDLFAPQVFFKQHVVFNSNTFKKVFPRLRCRILQFAWNPDFRISLSKVGFIPTHRFLCHQINNTGEILTFTDRQLQRKRIRTQSFLHHLQNAGEVRADSVHLVNKNNAWDTVAFSLMPDGF